MTMVEAPFASTPVLGSVRVVAVGDPTLLVRGRPAEFRKHGLTIVNRITAVSALLELGRDPSAVVLIPSTLDDFPILPFVDVLRSVAHVPVIAAVESDCSAHTLTELVKHGVTATVTLPATPTKLAAALHSRLASDKAEPVTLTIDELSLDEYRHEITWHGTVVSVTPTQFTLLRELMVAYPRVIPLQELIEQIEQENGRPGVKTRVTVGRLRAALNAAVPDRVAPIESVHGVGYRIRA